MATPFDPSQPIDESGGRVVGRRTLIKALAGAGVVTVGAAPDVIGWYS
jgi:predicted ATPase